MTVAPNPRSAPTALADDGVINLLHDLVPHYVRRVQPVGYSTAAPWAAIPQSPLQDQRTVGTDDGRGCDEIEGVVTIDWERRVAWPAGSDRPAAASLRPVGDVIEILDESRARRSTRSLDRRVTIEDLTAVVDDAVARARRTRPDSTGRASQETCVAALHQGVSPRLSWLLRGPR